jgi:hypothetical protein
MRRRHAATVGGFWQRVLSAFRPEGHPFVFKEYNVGVAPSNTYKLKRMGQDYYENL